ncbi:MAG: hypothetical protein BroJett029_01770 [Alphaproteobacteria bacterium]|nr:MAG: hypothetical protein BroJett029_01770 [Alphaproteobacteria bacterium]
MAASQGKPGSGGCQCGAVRYDVTGPPLETYVCHCLECRKQSSSAFGISVIVRSADVRLLQGELRRWSRAADSGRTVDCFFCPRCGSRVWHGDKDRGGTVSIKGGSLDLVVDLRHAVHIWTSRKLPGVLVPADVRQFPTEPD